MKPQLTILAGASAGHIEVFSKAQLGLGRHPACDLRFDPEHDLAVSARHAEIVRQGAHWYVRDLGSRNGTFVNGHRIRGDTKLDDTDQIRLGGDDGPVVEIRLVPEGTPDGVLARASPRPLGSAAAAGAALVETAERPAKTGRTTQRIRAEVVRQTKKLRTLTVVLFGLLLVVAGVFLYENRRQAAAQAREVAAIQARTDSILRAADQAVQALQGQVEGLAAALQRSQDEVETLRASLTTAQRSGSAAEVEALTRRLADATQALRYQQAAAEVDFRAILEANGHAVALIWTRFAENDIVTGTAFAVRPDGTLLTNRHVVAGESGTKVPREIAVQFADSRQVYRGRVVAQAADVDLAVVRVTIPGGVPTVRALNGRAGAVRQGDPVAIIGFPLGMELPMGGGASQPLARTTFSAGTVSKVLPDLIQVDGYGAQGASGSPVFDRNGEVVAVLYGGQPGTAGRVVYSLPASYALRLLQTLD